MNRVAVYRPEAPKGGLRTVAFQLLKGLRREFQTDEIVGPSRIRLFDVTFLNRLRRYDVVVYLGNFAPLSSVSNSFRKVLFLNGIVPYELRGYVLKDYSLKRRVIVSIGYIWWSVVNMRLVKPDAYICHSVTACELNRVPREKRVILPQFVLPEEVRPYDRYEPGEVRENVLLTYMSFAFSDRLLPLTVFLKLVKALSKLMPRPFTVKIRDPHSSPHVYTHGNVRVIVQKPLPREEFMRELARSTVFFDNCVDEELRGASVESGLVGTPVAKVVFPQFWGRQDYTEEELLVAPDFKTLVERLAECLREAEECKSRYGAAANRFIKEKRNWDAVKNDLVKTIRRFIDNG
ncbi:MAG: hypothetical protein QXT13_11840 [Pyrobaculum sp.]